MRRVANVPDSPIDPKSSGQVGVRFARGQKIGRVVAGHAVRSATGKLIGSKADADARARKQDEHILRFADELVMVAGTMKGAALKLGQFLAMFDLGLSSEATREEFTARLAPLFDRAPAVDDKAMMAVLESSLGPARMARLEVEPTPIAAASIGQVYLGTLDGDRRVAVKVQYPHVKSSVRADLKNLALIVKMGRSRMPAANLDDVVAEVSRRILAELDYVAELANHQRVHDFYVEHPAWRIPRPYAEVSTDQVLVTEYLDGIGFAEARGLPAEARDRIGEAVYRFYCGGVYARGEFCADPHPGNVLVRADGKVGFLDFGLYLAMDESDVVLQRNIFGALIEGRDEDVYRLAVDGGFILDEEAMSMDEFAEYMRMVAGWHLSPQRSTVTAEVARRTFARAVLPGSGHFRQIQRQGLLEAHVFSRRTELSVCELLGQLEATAPWGSIVREWIYDDVAASTPMGVEIENWACAHGRDGVAGDLI
jgi:predicted unusual protein kinase regulating ubiquinone biosynthesis (AarF/ABC1/UbiB family)